MLVAANTVVLVGDPAVVAANTIVQMVGPLAWGGSRTRPSPSCPRLLATAARGARRATEPHTSPAPIATHAAGSGQTDKHAGGRNTSLVQGRSLIAPGLEPPRDRAPSQGWRRSARATGGRLPAEWSRSYP